MRPSDNPIWFLVCLGIGLVLGIAIVVACDRVLGYLTHSNRKRP